MPSSVFTFSVFPEAEPEFPAYVRSAYVQGDKEPIAIAGLVLAAPTAFMRNFLDIASRNPIKTPDLSRIT